MLADHHGLVVRQFMTPGVHTVPASARLVEVEQALARRQVACVPVLDGWGHPLGAISRFDLLRIGRLRARRSTADRLLELPHLPALRVMHRGLHVVAPDTAIAEAADALIEQRVHRLFVLDEGALVGVLSTKDLVRAVAAAGIEAPLRRHHRSPVLTIDADETVEVATDALARARVTGLAVVEGDRTVGFFGQVEALEARDLSLRTPVEQVMSTALLCLPQDMPLHEAAVHAAATRARRVLTIAGRRPVGILTGIDFGRAVLAARFEPGVAPRS